MRAVLNTKARLPQPADLSIAKHLGDSFGVFKGKAKHHLRLRFDAFAARLVGEREWHPSQKIKRLADGEIELSLTLGSLEEVERWVLSWGEHAVVLEPMELKRRVCRAATAILAAT